MSTAPRTGSLVGLTRACTVSARPAYRWELLALCWCCFFLVQADRQAFNVVLPLIRSELHATDVQLGAIVALFSLVFALLLPLSGYVGDVANRKRVVLSSLVVWSLGTVLAGAASGFFSLLVCVSIATAGGESFYFPSANSLIGQFHQRSRSFAMSIHQSSLYVGLILSGLMAGWIGDHFGWRATFLILGFLGLILAPVFAWRVRNTPQPEAPPSSLFENLPFALEAGHPEALRSLVGAGVLRHGVRERGLFGLDADISSRPFQPFSGRCRLSRNVLPQRLRIGRRPIGRVAV